MAKMASGDITPTELDFSRDYLAGVYPIQSETAEQVADRVLTAAAFELPADYNSTYPERIRAVSLAGCKSDRAAIFYDQGPRHRARRKCLRFSRRSEKGISGRRSSSRFPFDQIDATRPDLRKAKQASAAATPESLARGKNSAGRSKSGRRRRALSVNSMAMKENGTLATARRPNTGARRRGWFPIPIARTGNVELQTQTIMQVCDGK